MFHHHKHCSYYCIMVLIELLLSSCDNNKTIIDGYQDQISYYPTNTVNLYLNSSKQSNQNINLYNINNQSVDRITVKLNKQDLSDTSYWWKYGFGYTKTTQYIPKNLISGIYYFEGSSPFIIKNPERKGDILLVYPSNTINAYNKRGGRSSYTKPMGEILSFKRPTKIQKYTLPFLKWLNKQKFNVDYICDKDLEDYDNIRNYKLIIIAGHNEYWSRRARQNFDDFVNKGGNAIILSGNTMWWQIRYHGDKQICYKNSINDSLVPDTLKTINWSNPNLQYPVFLSIGSNFVLGGYGLKKDSGWDGYKIINESPLFNGTGIKLGDILKCPTAEFDGTKLNFKRDYPLPIISSNFYKYELLGYDIGIDGNKRKAYMPLIIFQKNDSCGIVINTCSTNWCSDGFTGRDSDKIKKITFNFIDFLLRNKSVFTDLKPQ
jgi:hypothetical protein